MLRKLSVIRPCLRQVKITTWPAKRLLTSQPSNKPELKQTTECQNNSLIQLIEDDLERISTNRDHNSKRAHHFTIVYKGSERETRFSLLRHLSARNVDPKVIEAAARTYIEKSVRNSIYVYLIIIMVRIFFLPIINKMLEAYYIHKKEELIITEHTHTYEIHSFIENYC